MFTEGADLHELMEEDLEEEVVDDVRLSLPIVQEEIQHRIDDRSIWLSEEDAIEETHLVAWLEAVVLVVGTPPEELIFLVGVTLEGKEVRLRVCLGKGSRE